MSNSLDFTIGELQQILSEKSVRVVSSTGECSTVNSEQLSSLFPEAAIVTPNGHNGSYTIYSESGYSVLTPTSKSPRHQWSSV